jgi:hypothetical protein
MTASDESVQEGLLDAGSSMVRTNADPPLQPKQGLGELVLGFFLVLACVTLNRECII